MAESPEWDPHATWFQEQESVMTDSTGNICDRPVGWSTKRLVATVCSVSSQASQPDSDFGLALEQMVQVKSFVVVASEHAYIKLVKVMKSSKRGQPISAMQLAKNLDNSWTRVWHSSGTEGFDHLSFVWAKISWWKFWSTSHRLYATSWL